MVRLGSVAQIINGDRSSNYPSGDDFQKSGVPFINAGHLQKGEVNYSSMDYISYEKYNQLSGAKIQRNDILLCLRGSLGKYALVTTDDGAPASSIAVIRPNTEIIDPVYLSQIIASSIFQKQIEVENNGSSQPNLSAKSVSDFIIPLPPLEEQRNIASSLYDTDTMIELLEKQLSKKKAIKQGTMQELLTGKKRLPGFSDEWETLQLRNILSVGHGMSQYEVECPTGKYPILATGGVIGRANKYLWNSPSVLIGRKGTINKPQYMDGPFWSIDTLFYTKINDGYYPKFLYYVFCRIDWLSYNEASGVPSLSAKVIENIEVQMPKYDEQLAMADVLSEMDNEIASLEQKLEKYRQVKQGMMQQLLTGKIKLKNDVVDSVHTEQKTSAKISSVRSAHNHQFDDAVAIAAIVNAFYSDKYPLGRVKVQKLLYLLHRHQAVSVSDFKKKAAGPYADTVRYRGGEPIAKKNKYIVSESGNQGTRYSKGKNMAQALDYVERWGMQADFQWLKDNFLHTSRNDLELFATVDMAMCDLNEAGVPISVASIKNLIASNKEWKAKLSKTYFSDSDIARAIKKCAELFN